MIDTLWQLLEVVVNFYQGIIISDYVYSILGDRKKRSFFKSGGIVCAFILTITISIINYFINFEGVYLCVYIGIVFVYSLICLDGKILKKFFVSSFSVIFISIITSLVANFFALLFNKSVNNIFLHQSLERFISIVICQLIILYVYKLTLGIFKKENKNDLSSREWILILSVLFISVVIAGFLTLTSTQNVPSNTRLVIVICIAGIVLINIVTVYLVIDLSKKNSVIKENEMLRMQQVYQSNYIENAKAQYEIIRKMRHDIKNNYIVIGSLIKSGNIDKATKYINDNIHNFTLFANVINTNNDVVNAVINYKSAIAQELEIEVSIITVLDFDGISDIDLCSLISNLFDNAIEACKKMNSNKHIDFSIKKDESVYYFSMKNTIGHSVLEGNPELNTTKKDKIIHGFGTKIINDIAKKYNGAFDYYEENGYFICRIILKNK